MPRRYSLAYLPTPCLQSTAIVRTLYVATVISLCELVHRRISLFDVLPSVLVSTSPRFFLARSFLRSVICFRTEIGRVPFPLGLSPFVREMLISRGGFGIRLDLTGFHSPVESDAYLQVFLFPSAFRDDTACLPWSLRRTVWDVGLTGLAP